MTKGNPLIPADIDELATKIVAQHIEGCLMAGISITAHIIDMVKFAMTAERTRCADMAQTVSSDLATRIWGEMA